MKIGCKTFGIPIKKGTTRLEERRNPDK